MTTADISMLSCQKKRKANNMKLDEAIKVCFNFLERCDEQKKRSRQMVELASKVRRGEVDQQEAKRMQREIQGMGNTVNDAGDLELAIKVILKEIK